MLHSAVSSSTGQQAIKHMDLQDDGKEFYDNLNGTSIYESNLVILSAPIACLLRSLLVPWFVRQVTLSEPLTIGIKFLLDYFCLVLPPLLCSTIFSGYLEAVMLAMVFFCVSLLVLGDSLRSVPEPDRKQQKQEDEVPQLCVSNVLDTKVETHRSYLNWFRAYVNIGTAISILAVDFTLYPRKFAKTHTFGTGLMDYGVGGFVVCNAIVSPQAREVGAPGKTRLASMMKTFSSALPLAVLGFIRLLAVKLTDYHERMSEYGVHWNFFLTLAVVKATAAIIFLILPAKLSLVFSVTMIGIYQYALTHCGLGAVIQHGTDGKDSREDLFNANREGIVSCIGFLALYFAGVQLGRLLMKERSVFREYLLCLVQLNVLVSIVYMTLVITEFTVEPVSRRMANLSYFLWVIFVSCLMIIGFLAVELILVFSLTFKFIPFYTGPKEVDSLLGPCLLDAVNRNGLFYFLLANILTGLVNMAVHTRGVVPPRALLILISYMYILSIVTWQMHFKDISFRYW